MYETDLQQIFRNGTSVGGDEGLTSFFPLLKGRCYGYQFWGK